MVAHWKIGDGVELPESKEVIHQMVMFEIKKNSSYAVIFYNESGIPVWAMPLMYDGESVEGLTRDAYIKKHRLYLPE